ncbi:MAG: lipid A biosynthesis acyltransferase, partial [Alphaproteobacteria bacterium]|nr:lipid A biosynthesis acyltransferase [Alphaproteobacteria bacterium]
MSLRGLKYRLEYGLFRLLAGLARRLPLELASQLSGWLWRQIAPALARHRRALKHLQLAFPDKSQAEIERIARDMWENLGRVFAEGFHLQEIVQSDRIVFDNLDELKALGFDKTSVIACAAHLANWEIG